MFKSQLKDFKSPMSTIPPRGHLPENKGKFATSTPEFGGTVRPERPIEPGTVAQSPAQLHRPIPESVDSPAFQADFWANVNKVQGCWEAKATDQYGYGRTRLPGDRAHFRAHRVAYRIVHGVDPGHMLVCHRCDNPACVNPAHLFLGTTQDNVDDKVAKGRQFIPEHKSGEENPNSKLTEADARQIIRLITDGMTNTAIAARYAVGHSLVSRIRNGRSWQSVACDMGYDPKPSRFAPKSGRTRARLTP